MRPTWLLSGGPMHGQLARGDRHGWATRKGGEDADGGRVAGRLEVPQQRDAGLWLTPRSAGGHAALRERGRTGVIVSMTSGPWLSGDCNFLV